MCAFDVNYARGFGLAQFVINSVIIGGEVIILSKSSVVQYQRGGAHCATWRQTRLLWHTETEPLSIGWYNNCPHTFEVSRSNDRMPQRRFYELNVHHARSHIDMVRFYDCRWLSSPLFVIVSFWNCCSCCCCHLVLFFAI